jgi:hypothetical protein
MSGPTVVSLFRKKNHPLQYYLAAAIPLVVFRKNSVSFLLQKLELR